MQYHLKTPVEVTNGGQVEESEVLNIQDPNRGNLKDVSKIMEIAASAMIGAQKAMPTQNSDAPAPEEEDAGIDGKQALMILKLGSKYSEAIEAFDKFLLKYGKFDEVKVQTGSLDRMDLKDYDGALGEYFAGFCFSEFSQD